MSVYTASQAASVCGVSLRTIQRKMAQLETAGAWKDAAGQWHIPLAAMREAGLTPGRPSAPYMAPVTSLRQRDNDADAVASLRRENEQLREELRLRVAAVDAAEALAAARQEHINDLKTSLLVLEQRQAAVSTVNPGGVLGRAVRWLAG